MDLHHNTSLTSSHLKRRHLEPLLGHPSIKLLSPLTLARIGDRAFCAAGPAFWNSVPRNIREASSLTVFKKLLKTHYYV